MNDRPMTANDLTWGTRVESAPAAAQLTRDDRPWPASVDHAAYHGVLGSIVQSLAPETEADPVAILVQLLVMFGNCIGRTPHFRVGADIHHLNLFAAIVGTTAKGRKGMSRGQAQQIFTDVEPDWVHDCITGGLSSGEGLIFAVRDEVKKQIPVREKGRVTGAYDEVVEDPGVSDKRLMVIETELAAAFKVMMRDGSTLSPVVRQAWDGHDLRTLTKASATRATGPHISIIGHITADELRRDLAISETANGFGNRFLWLLVRRSRELPEGGERVLVDDAARRLCSAVSAARRAPELRRDDEAKRAWRDIYGPLSAGRPGMLGAMTARAEAQVMRLACLYALADESFLVRLPHLRAALALWRYCFDSAAWLFGDRLGDLVADAILTALRRQAPESMTKSEISALFNRHQPASRIDQALMVLVQHGLAKTDQDRGSDGRPIVRWYACEISEISEISPVAGGDLSLNSLISQSEEAFDGLI